MEVTSDPPSPIRPVGNSINLTCTVELSTLPHIDINISVSIQLYDPLENTMNSPSPTMFGSTYTSTATLNSFGRAQSGIYTCKAIVSEVPQNPYINDAVMMEMTRVTVGKHTG